MLGHRYKRCVAWLGVTKVPNVDNLAHTPLPSMGSGDAI